MSTETDRIRDRFETAWNAGLSPRIEDYVGDSSEPVRSSLIFDLLGVECRHRWLAGERPSEAEYLARFPDHSALIQTVLTQTLGVRRANEPAPPRAARDEGRSLLLGLLALQHRLISSAALVTALATWMADRSRPLGAILLERNDVDPPRHARLEQFVDEYLELHDGDVERSVATLTIDTATRESLVNIGNRSIDDLLSHISVSQPAERPHAGVRGTDGATEFETGRFQVIRPHAQGGLGAVFVAIDGELNREVALKQILDQHADDPASRRRFLQEAEITGGLEHPGIVPVYGLGVQNGGRPYYAMRFVRGESLKDVAEQFHRDVRNRRDPGRRSLAIQKLLRRFLDVCNAIDYAHSRGVLHRDIKPSNIIVGRHGETIVVDWGLAKILGKADVDTPVDEQPLTPRYSAAVTFPGAALGTPAYMSPEQARGDLNSLSPRSDIYGLGATLYTLLTGRSPFEGDKATVLQAVPKGDFPRPRAVKKSIDPALEAICLKAMASNPENRYPSARAFADDIERWLADEPVSARRDHIFTSAWRWVRKHRAFATTVVSLGAFSLAILYAGYRREAQHATALARSFDRERDRFDVARAAIKTFADTVAEDETVKNPELAGLRRKLLGRAQEFHQRLEELLQDENDPGSLESLASSYFDLGNLAGEIGDKNEAIRSHEQALAIRQRLADTSPRVSRLEADVATSLNRIGLLQSQTGKPDEAMSAYKRSHAILEKLAGAHPGVASYRNDLAQSDHNIGNLLIAISKPADAMESYERARTIRQTLVDAEPSSVEFARALAASHENIGVLLSMTGKPVESLASHQRALAIRQTLARSNPAEIGIQSALARSLDNIAGVLSATNRPADALSTYRDALAIRQVLSDSNPAVIRLQSDLAATHLNMGNLFRVLGPPAAAMASYNAALELLRKLVDANPGVTQSQRDLAAIHSNIGILLSDAGKPQAALASHMRALAIEQKLVDGNPGVAQFQSDLAANDANIALLYRQTGKVSEASDFLRKAIAIEERLVEANPTITQYQIQLAHSLKNLGDLAAATRKPADAIAAYQRVLTIRQELARAIPNSIPLGSELAQIHSDIGVLFSRTGKPGPALASHARALEIQQRLADAHPEVLQLQAVLGTMLNNMALEQIHQGKYDLAYGHLTRAASVERSVVRQAPANPTYRAVMGSQLTLLAQTCLALRRPAEAAAAARECAAMFADQAPHVYNCACFIARCASMTSDRVTAATYADEAMNTLRAAFRAGWHDSRQTTRDPDLALIRGRADFQQLVIQMMDRDWPRDPFVR